jgi:hypothetical protein
VSQEVLTHVSRNLDKIWITIKYLVGNIGDLTSTEFDEEQLEKVRAFEMGLMVVGSVCVASIVRSERQSARTLQQL